MLPDIDRFKGSEQARNCEFCAIFEGVDPDKIPIIGTGSASALISKKDGHPLVLPLMHVNGMENDQISKMAIRSANELAENLFPHIRRAYEDLYYATGYSMVINFGSHQNIPHYHVHWEAYTGNKKEGTSEQIVIDDIQERHVFAEAIRRSLDPEGLSDMFIEPTH